MFQLTNTRDKPRRPFSRVATLQAFLDRPTWDERSVRKARSIIGRDYWYISDDSHPIVDGVEKALKEWKKIDDLAPKCGSLRLALVRPIRRDRIERVLKRLERHREWRLDRLRLKFGHKDYKTQAARAKQESRFADAIADDPVLRWIWCVEGTLRSEIRHNRWS